VKWRKLCLARKTAKLGCFFSAKLVIRIISKPDGSPRPSGTGPIWNRQQGASLGVTSPRAKAAGLFC